MKKLPSLHWVFLLLVLSCSGCKDFLTIAPEDELARNELLGTVRGANAAVIGLYHRLSGQYQYRMPVYADLPANLEPLEDEQTVDVSDLNGNRLGFARLHARQTDAELEFTGMTILYQDSYETLFQAADILAALATITEGPAEQLSSLAGEAKAIRAILHFDLVRLFAQAPGFNAGRNHLGVVLINEVPGIFDFPARATVAEVYASIRADLEAAAEDINPDFSRRSGDPYWLTPEVVYGLLARVAAYQQDWAGCQGWADRCITNSDKNLTANALYLQEWDAGRLGETLWELDLQRLVDEGEQVDFESPARVVGAGNEVPFLQVSEDLLNQYAASDIRQQLTVTNADRDRVSRKWPYGLNLLRNPPLLRLSEVYLLRAEAAVELGQLAEARADYLAVRQRAEPNAAVPALEQATLREEIRQERRRELALEGHHFFDLGRWGQPLVRPTCASFVTTCSLPYPDAKFILPIPQEAILRNTALEQNPGY